MYVRSLVLPVRRKDPEMVNSAEWAELYNEAFQTQYYSPEDIRRYRENSDPDLFPNVNWFDTLFDDMAESERVNLNISGGGDIVRYYVAGSFYNENSIYKNAVIFMDIILLCVTTNLISQC